MCHLCVVLDQPECVQCAQGPNQVLQVTGTWSVLVPAGLMWEAATFSGAGGWMAWADLTVQSPQQNNCAWLLLPLVLLLLAEILGESPFLLLCSM